MLDNIQTNRVVAQQVTYIWPLLSVLMFELIYKVSCNVVLKHKNVSKILLVELQFPNPNSWLTKQ